MLYKIVRVSDEEPDQTDYWNNDSGWGDEDTADVFSEREQATLNLPVGGAWLEVAPRAQS